MDSKQCGKFDDKELRIMSDVLLEKRWNIEEKAKDEVAKVYEIIAENRANI